MQIRRNAGNWLIQARDFKKAKKIGDAERALQRYVAFRPEDEEAAEEMLEIHKQLFAQEPARYYKALGNSYERMVGFPTQ